MITGFPSPAQGYEENLLDLNKILIKHPAATVLMQIKSSRYVSAGIYKSDLVIIDRSLEPGTESIVVYEENGEFHIGRLERISSSLIVFGVVISIIHNTFDSGGSNDFACRR